MRLSVVGLGKLGACTAACFASKGFKVIGIDINKSFVDAINNGKAPVYEPMLQELISTSKDRLTATCDYREALKESDITFLIVPTPSKQDGHFSDKYLQEALKNLSLAFKTTNKRYHLFVITSTVSPKTTEERLIPIIESVSGKKLNEHFGVCYNPEFIALGSVISDFLNPDMVLIGESNSVAGEHVVGIYNQVCENKPYFARMSIISAEIAKISFNSYMTMKISFANTLANICEKIPSADVDAITKALGSDRRISPYYLKGGMGFGGPCFPRDNRAFAAFAQDSGIDALLAKTTDVVNQIQIKHLISTVIKHISTSMNKTIFVLGLAYKPNTPVIEESASIKLIENLLKEDLKIIVYDPLAMDNARSYFGDMISYSASLKDGFSNASICVVTTQADEFKIIDANYIVKNPTIIIDCWRMLDPVKLGKNVNYIAIGKA